MLTTLLTKKPPSETTDAIWDALQAEPLDPRTEELWEKAAAIVEEIQGNRDWQGVVTEEEKEEGVIDEEEFLGVVDVDAGEGAEERRRRVAGEQKALLGTLRFWETGVPIELQPELPKMPPGRAVQR
jgi:hypothetical protein